MRNGRRRSVRPTITPLESRLLMASSPVGTWIGQDGQDFTGPWNNLAPDGVQDMHVRLTGLAGDRALGKVLIRGYGSGQWAYNAPGVASPADGWGVAVVRDAGATTADLFFEPYQVETGRPFQFDITYGDGATEVIWVAGGAADPNLRMPTTKMAVAWSGQDGKDLVSPGPGVGPDGLVDVHLVLSNLSPGDSISAATLSSSGGTTWRYGTNRTLANNAELIRRAGDPTKADLYFSAIGTLAGQSVQVQIEYANGKTDTSTLSASVVNPTLAVVAAAPPTVGFGTVSATWTGQDGADLTGLGAVGFTVNGLPAGRAVVSATLSSSVGLSWTYKAAGQNPYADPNAGTLAFRRTTASSPTATLSFVAVRNEAGSSLTLRLTLDDGTMTVATLAGGAVDLSKLAPKPAASSVVARPGDDLNDLANRFGIVQLTAGTYTLTSPLVLKSAVTIKGAPGTVLRFTQQAGDAPWTAAIKVHAGNTTLDGFSVRFGGPVRWNNGVSYGPAIVGTTDNLDGFQGNAKVNLAFTNLDVESSPVLSGWEEAPRLFRLVSAQGGRLVGNTLKGGPTEFYRGPWTITGNTYLGTVDNTYCYTAFAGHLTYDLVLSGNTLKPSAGTGKAYRAVVMTGSGVGDKVQDNTIVGIGPMDSDSHPNPNAPEIILTESYGIRFEGTLQAVSADRRVVQIPTPQGGGGQAGDVLAILDGPAAGQYRRILQAISATTYLLDSPLPAGSSAISIVPGFVGESFSGNLIDARGSSSAIGLVLVGNHFGTVVAENRLLGGSGGMKLTAAPSESPVMWGWSHVPFLGASITGNTVEDSPGGIWVGVEHSAYIKSNGGRVYLTATIADNVVVWSPSFLAARLAAGGAAIPSLRLGDVLATEPGEGLYSIFNNRLNVPPGTNPGLAFWVDSGTVNGLAYIDARLSMAAAVPLAPTGLALVSDTGSDAHDRLTKDGRVTFKADASASRYQAKVGNGAWVAVASPAGFLPAGLTQGSVTVWVRGVDALGNAGPAASLQFTYDTVVPKAYSLQLPAALDTGRSSTDGITNVQTPAFVATGAPTDTTYLLRNGVVVSRRVGPGSIGEVTPVADGVYQYGFRIVDAAGNSIDGPTIKVTVKTATPPIVPSLTSMFGFVLIQWARADDWYEYRVGTSGPYIPLGRVGSFIPTGLSVGNNTLQVRAVDAAGNVGPPKSLTLTINPPRVKTNASATIQTSPAVATSASPTQASPAPTTANPIATALHAASIEGVGASSKTTATGSTRSVPSAALILTRSWSRPLTSLGSKGVVQTRPLTPVGRAGLNLLVGRDLGSKSFRD
ncbi:Ig-like domain-containing protein [Isosphaeraceae bacterium EP7]